MPSKSNKKLNTSQTPKKKGKDSQLNGKRQRKSSEEPTYIVEAILDKKKNQGVWTYKVKWQGYSEEECTWEPAKHLESVKDMIAEFNKKLKHKENEKEKDKDIESEAEEEEEEKAPPPEMKKSRSNKAKANRDKEEVKVEKNSIAKKNEGSTPYKKVKTDEPKEEKESSGKKTSYGHFKLGDKPRRIVTAKKEKDELIFTIEWEPQEDERNPLNTEMTSLELRKYDKDLLLDFYEERLKFIKPGPKDSGIKSANKTSQHKVEKMEEELPNDKNHKYQVVNLDDEDNHTKNLQKNKQSDIINLEDSPQEIKEEKLEEEEVKEVGRNEVPTQPIEEMEEEIIKNPAEEQKVYEVQNIIDNKGQATFDDLCSNVPDDIKNLALDPHYRVVTTNENLVEPAEDIKTNGHQNENEVEENKDDEDDKDEPQDLQLESPKEISDQGDDADIVDDDDDESSGLENI